MNSALQVSPMQPQAAVKHSRRFCQFLPVQSLHRSAHIDFAPVNLFHSGPDDDELRHQLKFTLREIDIYLISLSGSFVVDSDGCSDSDM